MIITAIIFGFLVLLFGYFYFSYKRMAKSANVAESEKIKHLTEKNFNQQIKTGVALVDFWAEWCMPCKMMTPVLNALADEELENVKTCKLNVETEKQIAARYSVRSIPTMILFKDGKEVNRFVGYKTKEFLVGQINKVR